MKHVTSCYKMHTPAAWHLHRLLDNPLTYGLYLTFEFFYDYGTPSLWNGRWK